MILTLLIALLYSTMLCADNQQNSEQDLASQPASVAQEHISYTIGPAIISGNIAFTGAALPGSKEYAITQHTIGEGIGLINGVTPEYVMLNYQPEQPNPLFNQKILNLIHNAQKLIAVPADHPNQLFLLENLLTTSQQSLLASPILPDIDGMSSSMITSYDTGITGTSDTSLHVYTLAAVASHDSVFGDHKSGFNLIKHTVTQEELPPDDQNKTVTRNKTHLELCEATLKAVPLGIDEDNSALSINGGVASVGNHAAIRWHPNLERFYIALQIKTKSDATVNQGGRALLVGRVDDDKLILDPVLPSDICQGMDKIIAATGPDQEVSLHTIYPFSTTAGIPYLLVVGGNGSPETTKNMISALPLTHHGYNISRKRATQEKLHGTIAMLKSNMQILYGYDRKIAARLLTTPANTQGEVYSCYDAAIAVGNFAALPHDITDVVISGNAVFVSVAQKGNGQQAGIFHSQAILDDEGRIAAWTQWQRFGPDCGIEKFSIQPLAYMITYLYSDTPIFGLKQWKQPPKRKKNEQIPPPTDSLEGLIQTIFPQVEGGLQALSSYARDIPGLNSDKQELSLLIALGQKKVALVQTGSLVNEEFFAPHKDNFLATISYATPQLQQHAELPARTLVLSDEVIESLGALSCAAIATNGTQAWLVVGGPRGAAILCTKDGNGWTSG